MKTFIYTAFDGHPTLGGQPIPTLTDKRIKARDSYQALARSLDIVERYVATSCQYIGTHRYYVFINLDGVRVEIGFTDIEKDEAGRGRDSKWTTAPEERPTP